MPEPAGQPFGRYLLLEELSRGGMGRIYRAVMRTDGGISKQVAIKRLLRTVSRDPDFVTRFADEARIACSLNHANIIQVFDFGQVQGEYFLTMELVDGTDLSRLIEAARLQGATVPLPAALYVAVGLCRGLGAAHRRRDAAGHPAPVVHRDVSPHNVLISRAGEVKVADFGIATAAERAMRTRTGLIVGKCRYLSPEQVLGRPVDARADVFACGCVLFETIVGRPLFDVDTPEQALGLLAHGPAPSLEAAHRPEYPELLAVLTRALQRNPDGRHADAAALARDLEGILRVVAPTFSADDLGLLLQRWCLSSASGADRATAGSLTAPDIHAAQTELLSRPPEPPTNAGAQTATLATHGALAWKRSVFRPGDPPPRRGVRVTLLYLVLAAAGSGLGAAAAKWSAPAHAPAPQALVRNTPIGVGEWRLRLLELHSLPTPRGATRRLLVRIAIDPPDQRWSAQTPPLVLESATGRLHAPIFWYWPTKAGAADNAEVLLLFSLSAQTAEQDKLRLFFTPPDGATHALLEAQLPPTERD